MQIKDGYTVPGATLNPGRKSKNVGDYEYWEIRVVHESQG